jgi:hypothetical protein
VRSLAEDLLIETFSLVLRLDPKLTLEDTYAELVLVERGGPSPELDVETHERAVHGFLERIEGDQPQSGLQGSVNGAGRALRGE